MSGKQYYFAWNYFIPHVTVSLSEEAFAKLCRKAQLHDLVTSEVASAMLEKQLIPRRSADAKNHAKHNRTTDTDPTKDQREEESE